jgi:hypothetical protein
MTAAGASTDKVGNPQFPRHGDSVDLQKLGGPRFLVTVDTEEEFDWSGPFTREQHGLTHLAHVPRFQALCEANAVKPLYLVDYPVAADGFGAELFSDLLKREVAEVGLQLHPWVNPPFDEQVGVEASYACNLPPALEREKLRRLFDIVADRLGVRPDSYRAGRYGAGAETPAILAELGIRVDTSVRPFFDYRGQGGPDYSRHPVAPYWVRDEQLMELPLTSVFGGLARSGGAKLFDRAFRSDTMRAVLARSGVLERIALTPEGIPLEKAIAAIDIAVEWQLPVLVFSFHSPSLAVGHTPYVRSEADLEKFYVWWTRVFDHLKATGVRPSTIAEITAAAFG